MASMELEPINGLTNQFRVDVARLDLASTAAKAAEQVAVHDYALKVVAQVAHQGMSLSVPSQDVLTALKEDNPPKPESTPPQIGFGERLRKMVAATEAPIAEVRQKDIARDVMFDLHSDRRAGKQVKAVDEDEELFKSLTEAGQYEEKSAVQSLYARTVASRTVNLEVTDPSILEKTRYKTHIALLAGKSRFSSTEEVDAWKEQEIQMLPHQARAFMLMEATGLYTRAMGAKEDGSFSVPHHAGPAVKRSLEASTRAITAILGEDVDVERLLGADLEVFDSEFESLLMTLKGMLELHKLGYEGALDGHIIIQAADVLQRAAESLENYQVPIPITLRLGKLMLTGGFEGGPEDRLSGLSKERSIDPTGKYHNKANGKIYYDSGFSEKSLFEDDKYFEEKRTY